MQIMQQMQQGTLQNIVTDKLQQNHNYQKKVMSWTIEVVYA